MQAFSSVSPLRSSPGVCVSLRTGRDDGRRMHLPRQPRAPLVAVRQHPGCHGSCVAAELNALARTRPVLRIGDDTHTERATTLRSHPLVALAVRGCVTLLPARHVSRAGLVGARSAGAVASPVALVAVPRLALPAPHRLAARLPPAPAVSVKRLRLYVSAVNQTSSLSITSGWEILPRNAPDAQPWMNHDARGRNLRRI